MIDYWDCCGIYQVKGKEGGSEYLQRLDRTRKTDTQNTPILVLS